MLVGTAASAAGCAVTYTASYYLLVAFCATGYFQFRVFARLDRLFGAVLDHVFSELHLSSPVSSFSFSSWPTAKLRFCRCKLEMLRAMCSMSSAMQREAKAELSSWGRKENRFASTKYSISRRCGAALLCFSTYVKMHAWQAKLRYILDCTPQHCCPLPRSETSAEFTAADSDCVHVCV